ncbi:protein kinase C delta type-like [Xenopus laevis]|uniref:Protein kinase C delta type-like n=1 Tax=Xenopus laevis TaxID=8355 RepID=A0A8J1KKT7_XENLA|nr:protein kinase C delta type-like [Xenopus laevis]XP_041417930.1 protein kinase C delta type-like [Xenopus laevis]
MNSKKKRRRGSSPVDDPGGKKFRKEEKERKKRNEKEEKKKNHGEREKKTTAKKRSRSPDKSRDDGRKQKKIRGEPETPPALDINNYRLIKQIGKGSFGKVMLASYMIKDQLVAVKIIEKKKTRDFKNVRNEASVLQLARRCPYLCRGMATLQTQSLILLVLEYMSGGTLDDLITTVGRLNSDLIMFYSAELAVGLKFLHANGIVHRDLKPQNILLDEEGHLKIADFGLVCTNMFKSNTQRGRCGTPGYIAPEVLADMEYNSSADWWSFGVILYKMATGILPYSRHICKEEQLERILTEKPQYPEFLSAELRDLLKQLLRKKPKHRLGVYADIRDHPFYSTIDWVQVERRSLLSPIIPPKSSVKGFSKKHIPFPEEDPSETRMVENFNYIDPSWQE